MRTAYTKPVHYSERELLEADIADLRVDIRCALRDGLLDYARQCEQRLAALLTRIKQGACL